MAPMSGSGAVDADRDLQGRAVGEVDLRRGSGRAGRCGPRRCPVPSPDRRSGPEPQGLGAHRHPPGAERLGDVPARGIRRRTRSRAGARPRPVARPARPGPACITTTRSASENASSWSWVTNRIASPSCTNSSRSSTTSRSRSARSSAPSGSSSIRSFGRGRERARERHALLLAAGEIAHASVLESLQPDERERRARPCVGVRARDALHAQPERDVAEHVAVLEQRMVLEHEPEAAAVRRRRGDVDAVERHASVRLGDEAGDGAEQRALAAAARPEHADDLAVGDLHVDGVEREEVAVAHREALERQHQPSLIRRSRPIPRGTARWRGSRPRSAP